MTNIAGATDLSGTLNPVNVREDHSHSHSCLKVKYSVRCLHSWFPRSRNRVLGWLIFRVHRKRTHCTQTERDRRRDRERDRNRERDGSKPRETDRNREIDQNRETEIDRNKEKQRETETESMRETGREKERGE